MDQKIKTKLLLLQLSIKTYSLFDIQTRREYLQLKQKQFTNIDKPCILDVLCNHLYASRQGKKVNFFWIPNHTGIHGNRKGDSAARSALQFEIVKFRIPHTDLKYFINL